jgi:hypothetical protein
MSLKLNTASGGSITLQEADTASNLTLTVPAVSGTMITTASTFAGTGPAFGVYAGGGQSVSSGSFTKVQWNTEVFDTNNCFDTTNYRFTPNVAGYYQINTHVDSAAGSVETIASIYKNGSELNRGFDQKSSNTGSVVSSVVYCNGSTDYIEIYVYFGSNTTVHSTYARTFFNGCLVRTA